MPVYEYKCLSCQKDFLVATTLKEHESGPPFCPACKGTKVEQVMTSFSAKTSRKS